MTGDTAQMRVLAVTSSEQAVNELHAIFAHSRWRLDAVSSLADALNFVRAETIPVVISGISLPDGSWQDILRRLDELSDPPRLILVAPPPVSREVWRDAVTAGVVDVVERPLDLNEVFSAFTFAWRSWHSSRTPMPLAAFHSNG